MFMVLYTLLSNVKEKKLADIRAFRAYRRGGTYYRDIRMSRINHIAVALLIALLIVGIRISGLPGMGGPYHTTHDNYLNSC